MSLEVTIDVLRISLTSCDKHSYTSLELNKMNLAILRKPDLFCPLTENSDEHRVVQTFWLRKSAYVLIYTVTSSLMHNDASQTSEFQLCKLIFT